MNKKDKEKLLKLGLIVGLITVTLFFMFGLGLIPLELVVAVVVALHYVVVSPGLCKHVYKLYGQPLGFVRWVPVLNEVEMFSGANYYAAVAASLITLLVFLLRFVPNRVVGSVFGLKAGMFWGYNLTSVLIVALVITNFIFGFGFCRLLRELNNLMAERYSVPAGKLETVVFYVLLLVPFIRLCPLIVMWTKAVNMDRLEPSETKAEFVEK